METVTTLDDKVRAFKVLLDKKMNWQSRPRQTMRKSKTSNRKSHSRWWTRKSRILRWMASSTACRRKRDTPRFQKKN